MFLINNCFLPPKLPQQDENEVGAAVLMSLFHELAQKYGRSLSTEEQIHWELVTFSMSLWKSVFNENALCEEQIMMALRKMKPGSTVLIFVKSQNAAITITKQNSLMKFECWEVSAKQEDVLSTKDALIREYPARAVQVPCDVVLEKCFLQELVKYLYGLAVDTSVPISMEKVYKGGSQIEESRQSNHPRLVTEWLFTLLASYGTPCQTEAVRKRTHDDVQFQRALHPWRRSPMWSCMKVALQLMILNSPLKHYEHNHYKNFMLYFLADLSMRLFEHQPDWDYLHIIRTKIARRAAKIGTNMPDFVVRRSTQVVQRISVHMKAQWKEVQTRDNVETPAIEQQNFDLDILLTRSGPQLFKIYQEALDDFKQVSSCDEPSSATVYRLSFSQTGLPLFCQPLNCEEGQQLEIIVAVQDWIDNRLKHWMEKTDASSIACTELKSLMNTYWGHGHRCFWQYADLMSGVLLRLMEMWTALDRMTIKLHPLLCEYSPEIPPSIFEPLLLASRSHLVRLHTIEQYLKQRHEQCLSSLPSIFGPVTTNSLSVRVFDRSPHLKHILKKIQDHATVQRASTISEFHAEKKEFDELMKQASEMICDEYWITEGERAGESVHRRKCKKCGIIRKAYNLHVEKFEEPLPTYEPQQKAVVFELRPPQTLLLWRNATWELMHDILSTSVENSKGALFELKNYEPLKNWMSRSSWRIGLASVKKPHRETHRINAHITIAEDAVILPHAMKYQMYDSRFEKWTVNGIGDFGLSKYCRAQIGNSPYTKLIETIHGTHHSQNNIIARQATTPIDITVHDWIIFGSLRAGPLTQLINLLRSLLAQDLNHNTSSTIAIIEQMLFEAGERDSIGFSVLRRVHREFQEPAYVTALFNVCSNILNRIELNWKETVAVSLVEKIVQRILSLADSKNIKRQCISFLLRLRSIALRWMSQLASIYREQCNSGCSSADVDGTRRRLLDVALLARAS